jgi:hypothetical protein
LNGDLENFNTSRRGYRHLPPVPSSASSGNLRFDDISASAMAAWGWASVTAALIEHPSKIKPSRPRDGFIGGLGA